MLKHEVGSPRLSDGDGRQDGVQTRTQHVCGVFVGFGKVGAVNISDIVSPLLLSSATSSHVEARAYSRAVLMWMPMIIFRSPR